MNRDKKLLCTMTSRKNKGAPKKLVIKMDFARLRRVPLAKGKSDNLSGKQKDAEAKGISAPLLIHAAGDGVATKHTKAAKAPNRRQKKGTTSTEKEPRGKNDLGKTKKNEGCLTDAQFEEIFQSVLRKSLQESLENSGKKTFSAELAVERGPRRETLEVSLTTKKGISRNKSEEKSKAVLLEAEKEHELKMKKHSKLSASKNRKRKHEKPEADNGGCKENRKGALKKKVQGNAPVVIDLEEMQQEEKADGGSSGRQCIAWAQCSYPNCEKWRRLSSDIDPSVLPKDWSCSQNPDCQYNSCSIPEETCSGSEDEVVYALYFTGSLVWAKQYGHPWWPGIIEADPDFGDYLLFSSQKDFLPSEYHVTFLGNSVTRAWISASMLRNFGDSSMERISLAKLRRKGDKRKFKLALKMAKEAEKINIQERIRMFGFHSRFSERALPKDIQDHVTIVCKSSAKKRAQGSGGEKKKPATPNKSQEKLLPGIPVMKPDVNGKKKTKTKRDKKVSLATEDLPPLSKKSRKEVPCSKAEGSSKAKRQKNGQKGFRKSSSVPQHKSNKAKHLSPCKGSSATDLALSSSPSKKDSLDKAKIFPMAESKDTEGLKEPSESVAFDQDGQETSQEMDCPEDFALVLFED